MKWHQATTLALSMTWAVTAACSSPARHSEPPSALAQRTLQPRIIDRDWDTKGQSSSKSDQLITVVATDGLDGDIVILRWSEDRTEFQAEIYELEAIPGPLKSWTPAIGGSGKSIVQQPGGALHIFERVGGPDGGLRIEEVWMDGRASEKK